MKHMRSGKHFAWRGLQIALTLAWLIGAGSPLAGQSQHRATAAQTATPPAAAKEDSLAALLQRANEAIDKMDFAAALDPLEKYIAQRPDDAYAHFQLGYSYAGLKRPEDAKTEFSRAIALDPKMAAAHLNLGLVELDEDPGAAADSFRRAAELQPTESRPRFLAGYALERSGKYPDAIEQYRLALAISPQDYEAHFALGRVLLRTNAAAEAEAQFREAIQIRGDAAPARLGLAEALMAQKKDEEASDALAEYLKLNPGDRSAHFDRASALLNLGQYDEALGELNRASTDAAPSADALKMRGEIYMQQKKWMEAGETLAQAATVAPHDPEITQWLGHVNIQLHDYPAAIRILSEAYTQNPQSADTLRDLSDAFFLHEDYAAALGAMDKLAGLEPPKPGSWFVRAICYDKLSRKAEAVEAYQKFLDLDGGQHDAQDFQARHRILTLQGELGQSKKK
jgi:protein O-GlcNAc transferase